MTTLITLLQTLNTLSPLAIIALLVLVLLYQARNRQTTVAHTSQIASLKANDLHELPEIAATLRRIETTQAAGFATVIAKLNGR